MGKPTDHLSALANGRISLTEFLALIERLVADGTSPPEVLAAELRDALATAVLPPDVRDAVEDELRLLLVAPNAAARLRQAEPAAPAPEEDDRTHIVAPQRPPQAGDVIKNRFVLEAKLGAGGMGTVFKALDRVRQEAQDREPYVAIKLLSDAFRRLEISAIALQREAKKALSLSHPNIVRVYDFDKDGDLTFMTMEYLSGRSFDRIIKEPGFAGLPLAAVLEYMRPVADALGYAHSRGLVHSDFKPSNVFVTDDGQVKVIDFGIARAVRRAGAGDAEQTVFDPSALGALTLPYASPEQIAGLDPDPRDDIFAAACVTYELLTGRHPFGRKASATARAEGLAPARIDSLSRGQWEALRHALAFDRVARTPSIKAFVAGLAEAPAGGRNWRRWLFAVVVAVSLAVIAYVIIEIGERSRPPKPPQPPEDVSTQAKDVLTQATLTALVHGVACALLEGTLDDGSVQLFGYAEQRRREELIATIKGFKNVIGIGTAVQAIPEQHCPAIDRMAPLVRSNQQGGFELMIVTPPPGEPVRLGDALPVEIRGPAMPAYVYVDYHRFDGTVVHLLPRSGRRPERSSPEGVIVARDLDPAGLRLTASAGEGLMTVIAAPEPLFADNRPTTETSEAYLASLRDALARIQRRHGENAVAADFVFVSGADGP
ncbi:MAG: protein kinase [Defluviicoccus sp.]